VQRWEHDEGLPVHRHLHAKGGSVYAYRPELDEWLARRGATLQLANGSGFVRRRIVATAALVIVVGGGTWLERAFRPIRGALDSAAPADAQPDAYQAFLKGRYFRDRRMAGGCVQAESYYQRAIALDPGLANAHADLAFCYGFDRLQGRLSVTDAAVRARREAVRAITIDPSLPDAHVALALIAHRLDFDWEEAERGFQHALRVNPSHVYALIFYGELLYAANRGPEALEMFRRSLLLQPVHLGHNVGLGFALYNLRRYESAVEQLNQTAALDPNWAKTRFWLAESYAAMGAKQAAVQEYLTWLRLTLRPERAATTRHLAQVFEQSGWQRFWEEELVLAEEETTHRGSVWQIHDPPTSWSYMMARRYARVGHRGSAVEALRTAFDQRSHLMVFMDREPLFDTLRSDPQFVELSRWIRSPR
jgi:tetratricopeptide (TPR) repeat protein